MSRYNLTPDQLAEMISEQDGRCKICKIRTKLVVDHCHEELRVRGLLCASCNTGIGMLQDSTAVLRAAIAYLEAN
jgi:hypothetical protein